MIAAPPIVLRRPAVPACLPGIDPSGKGAPCPVTRCDNLVEDAIFCSACWQRLPEGVQRASGHIANAVTSEHASPARQQAARELVEQARRRLSAELAGPLSEEEQARADQLCRRIYNMPLGELLDAPGGYFPKLDCSTRWTPDREQRELHAEMADFYDRAQALRGDPRRVVRMDFAGL